MNKRLALQGRDSAKGKGDPLNLLYTLQRHKSGGDKCYLGIPNLFQKSPMQPLVLPGVQRKKQVEEHPSEDSCLLLGGWLGDGARGKQDPGAPAGGGMWEE